MHAEDCITRLSSKESMSSYLDTVVALPDKEVVAASNDFLPPLEACEQLLEDCQEQLACGRVGVQANVLHKGDHECPVEAVTIPCIATYVYACWAFMMCCYVRKSPAIQLWFQSHAACAVRRSVLKELCAKTIS